MKFSKPKYKIDSLISTLTEVEGNLQFKGGMRIEGYVNGNVTSDVDNESILIIADTAVITGEVRAANIIINGRVKGEVISRKVLELQEKAVIQGNVTYELLSMHSGAIISGQLIHTKSLEKNEIKTEEELERLAA
jgi:cytoskeletal protein CcmA (bactofilin family)